MFKEKDLESQEKTIKKYILIGFFPTIILVIIFFIYQSNSIQYNKKQYLKERDKEYNGIIILKTEEGNYTRSKRTFILDSNIEDFLYKEEFDKLSIGDSVVKLNGSDSTKFYLKNGQILYKDYNKFKREKYFKLVKEKSSH